MKRQITIDGINGTWTPDPDDVWEYVGKITKFEEGYEYQYNFPMKGWAVITRELPGLHYYRRRPKPIWQGAGFYLRKNGFVVGLIKLVGPQRCKSDSDAYRIDSLVRLVRKFTTEEILSIVNEGVWPEVGND